MDVLYSLKLGIDYIIGDPIVLVFLTAAIFGGMVFGAIPGLTAALGVSLMLPFTFIMSPEQGLTVLIGIYVGGISGGLISAVLLNIPGSPASLVSCFDGSPMAKQGRAGDVLTLGVFSSLIGGLISALALVIIAPQLAKVALIFGPWEYFAMGIMGLSVVISLCSKDMVKGVMSAILGIMIAMVGIDPVSSAERFTFGFWQLGAGLNILATLMGLFALSEILTQVRNLSQKFETIPVQRIPLLPAKRLIKGKSKTFAISGIIGTLVGILPGVGQSTASLLAYNQARQMSKTPEKFGTGHEDGVIASEAANNACCGGAMIPMMTLGIPGDLVTAVLLGGLVIHGLQPGPLLFTANKNIIGSIFVAYILANIIMYVMEMGLMKVFIKLLKIPLNFLFPIILLMCVIGTITVNNRLFDSWVLLVIGVAGYVLLNLEFSLPPIVLGYILGPIIESNFRIGIISSQGSLIPLFQKPIAMGLIVFGILMVLWPQIKKLIFKNKQKGEIENESSNEG